MPGANQVGNGPYVDNSVIRSYVEVADVTDIAVGQAGSCALFETYKVRCWGLGPDLPYPTPGLQVGNVSFPNSTSMAFAENLPACTTDSATYVSSIAVAKFSANMALCASMLTTSAVNCWSPANPNLRGTSATNTESDWLSATKSIVFHSSLYYFDGSSTVLAPVLAITMGTSHACAVFDISSTSVTGGIVCWGSGTDGRLGTNDANDYGSTNALSTLTPIAFDSGDTVIQASAGHDHTCAIFTSKAVRCWGANGMCQLGRSPCSGTVGNTLNSMDTLAKITFPSPFNDPAATPTYISAGKQITCVVFDPISPSTVPQGTCFGLNVAAQCGQGTISSPLPLSSAIPIPTPGNVGFSAIEAGGIVTCGLLKTLQVICWGTGNPPIGPMHGLANTVVGDSAGEVGNLATFPAPYMDLSAIDQTIMPAIWPNQGMNITVTPDLVNENVTIIFADPQGMVSLASCNATFTTTTNLACYPVFTNNLATYQNITPMIGFWSTAANSYLPFKNIPQEFKLVYQPVPVVTVPIPNMLPLDSAYVVVLPLNTNVFDPASVSCCIGYNASVAAVLVSAVVGPPNLAKCTLPTDLEDQRAYSSSATSLVFPVSLTVNNRDCAAPMRYILFFSTNSVELSVSPLYLQENVRAINYTVTIDSGEIYDDTLAGPGTYLVKLQGPAMRIENGTRDSGSNTIRYNSNGLPQGRYDVLLSPNGGITWIQASSQLIVYRMPRITGVSPGFGPADIVPTDSRAVSVDVMPQDVFSLQLRWISQSDPSVNRTLTVSDDIYESSFSFVMDIALPAGIYIPSVSFDGGATWSNETDPMAFLVLFNLIAATPPLIPSVGNSIVAVSSTLPNTTNVDDPDLGSYIFCKFGIFEETPAYFSKPLNSVICTSPTFVATGPIDLSVRFFMDYSKPISIFIYKLPAISAIVPPHSPVSSSPDTRITLLGFSFPAAAYGAGCKETANQNDGQSAVQLNITGAYVVCKAFHGSGSVAVSFSVNGMNDYSSAGKIVLFDMSTFEPSYIPHTGASVVVYGSGFSTLPAFPMACRMTDQNFSIPAVNPTKSSLSCDFPARNPGLYDFGVHVSSVTPLDLSMSRTRIRYYTNPTISAISPTSGSFTGGTEITLYGFNISAPNSIDDPQNHTLCSFGDASTGSSRIVAYIVNGTARCFSPPGFGSLIVQLSLNGYDFAPADPRATFTFILPSFVSPSTGPIVGGTKISFGGSGISASLLQPQSKCYFSTSAGNTTTVQSSLVTADAKGSLGCVVPALPASVASAMGNGGLAVATMRFSLNGGLDMAGGIQPISYYFHNVPQFTGFLPSSGASTGGGIITLFGSSFTTTSPVSQAMQVFFDDQIASNCKTLSSTMIQCVPPAGQGTVQIALSYNKQVDIFNVGLFNYFSVQSISPVSGSTLGGTQIQVSGSGFVSDLYYCRVGSDVITAVKKSDSLIECTTKAQTQFVARAQRHLGALGVVSSTTLDVSIDGKAFATGSGAAYDFYLPPVITMVTPRTGPISGGTLLTIYGSNLFNAAGILCRFGEKSSSVSKAVFNSTDGSVMCNTTYNSADTVTVYLSMNQLDYTPQNASLASFTYQLCPAGYFARLDTDPCTPCPPGFITSGAGKQSCDVCGLRAFAEFAGSTSCTSCPENTAINSDVSDSLQKCQCIKGFYVASGKTGEACTACPTGADCSGGVAIPIALPGYWNAEGDNQFFFACESPEQCPGGGSAKCETGAEGKMCAFCAPNYYKSLKRCHPCPSYALFIMIGFVIFCILIAILILSTVGFSGASRYGGTVNVAVDFFQILAIIGRLNFNMPPLIKKILSTLSAPFAFSSDVLATECSVPSVSYQVKWVGMQLVPVAFGLIFMSIFLLAVLQNIVVRVFTGFSSKRKSRIETVHDALAVAEDEGILDDAEKKEREERLKRERESWISRKIARAIYLTFHPIPLSPLLDRVVNGFLMFFGLCFMIVVANTFALFDCVQQPDNTWTLTADASQICYQKWWWKLFGIAIASIVVYVIGLPLFFAIFMYRNRRRLRFAEFAQRYSSLYSDFRHQLPFWGTPDKLLKVVIAVVSTFLTRWPELQVVVLLFVFLVALVMQQIYKPMAEHRDNTLEATLRACICLIISTAILYRSNTELSDASKMTLQVYVVGVICFASFFVLWTVFADIIYVYREEKKEISGPIMSFLHMLMCPLGNELFQATLRSGKYHKTLDRDVFHVLKSVLKMNYFLMLEDGHTPPPSQAKKNRTLGIQDAAAATAAVPATGDDKKPVSAEKRSAAHVDITDDPMFRQYEHDRLLINTIVRGRGQSVSDSLSSSDVFVVGGPKNGAHHGAAAGKRGGGGGADADAGAVAGEEGMSSQGANRHILHMIDFYTAECFSPAYLPVIRIWLIYRLKLISRFISSDPRASLGAPGHAAVPPLAEKGPLDRGSPAAATAAAAAVREEEDEAGHGAGDAWSMSSDGELNDGGSAIKTADADASEHPHHHKSSQPHGLPPIFFQCVADLYTFQKLFIVINSFLRVKENLNTALPMTKLPLPRPSEVPTMEMLGRQEMHDRGIRVPASLSFKIDADTNAELRHTQPSRTGSGFLVGSATPEVEALRQLIDVVFGITGTQAERDMVRGLSLDRWTHPMDTDVAVFSSCEQVRSARFADTGAIWDFFKEQQQQHVVGGSAASGTLVGEEIGTGSGTHNSEDEAGPAEEDRERQFAHGKPVGFDGLDHAADEQGESDDLQPQCIIS